MDGVKQYGHDIEDPNKPRTEDVLIFEKVDFASMLLSPHIVDGLYSANFRRPSPIQLKAVPLARCGFDLIVQAKSGTGKTLVFGITALDVVKTDVKSIQVLIIVPTREIALQIKDVLTVIGRGIKNLQVKTFIGGLDMKTDKKEAGNCHIAVVTPGRAKQLVEAKVLAVGTLKLLVLDEADKLMEPCFIKDIKRILKYASASKQVILASATLCDSVSKFIAEHMNEPMRVTATGVKLLTESENDVPKVLLGVKQFVGEVVAPANIAQQLLKKADTLVQVLKGIPFNQCIVFSNYQTRAESICNMLTAGGWPAVSICGKQEQRQRITSIAAFKEFRCRILLSTDLTARGLDVDGVSLVVNLDVPYNAATYLHRMGRAGRFGSTGIVISLIATSEEMKKFQNILFEIGGAAMAVHKLPTDLTKLNDTDSLDTVVALPPEDVHANVEDTEDHTVSVVATPVEKPKTNGAIRKQSLSSNGLEGLCTALLETYLEPKPALELRSYQDLDLSRQNWTRGQSCRPAILKKNRMRYAPESDEEPIVTFDETILKRVMEKNWSDESRVSSDVDVDASSESASELSSAESVPVAEVRKLKKACKTVTVNLPGSARRSSAASGNIRGRKKFPASSGRCCDHICENAQWNHEWQNNEQRSTSSFNPSNYFSSQYPSNNQNAQWYSNWENQLSHIRFYVEYMEYWRNTCMNMYSNSSQNM